MATKTLAAWALALQFSNLTQPVTDMAVKSIYNWAGCAIGGYSLPPASVAYEALSSVLPYHSGNVSVLGSRAWMDIQTAALVNGIASHVDDYDDTHADTPIHPSRPVASALLAVTEWNFPVSGQDFLTAFVAGVEAECKLGVAVYPEHYDVGWHITSTTGSVGAAVAVGKLLGLSLEHLQHAISIAAVQVNGMHESFGTDTKPFHVGRAAQSGLLSALLAQNGYGGSLQGLEAERGWAHVVSTRENLTAEFSTLGETWELSKNTFKPFPCDRIIHAAIDGCVQIHDQAVHNRLDLGTIKNVTARTNPMVLFLTDNPEPRRKASPAQFTDEMVRNTTVVKLRANVHITADEGISEHEAFYVHIEHALGSIENPLSTQQLKDKFIEHAGSVIGKQRAEKAFRAFSQIANTSDVGSISRKFRK
ncbi:hypothetical protein BDV36DRAFT_284834 [Aspergillus pseudocaelatus]|uniref:MmgE/PrpD N-terminal domain-containing protein n=1 Tax=Aspergillus pseudocaelatus TaxID=1825620 RepID=A0ABQ6WGH5_9EURO|nr:hypothetical protein BDV36DRAFT_284834 [Aspergillus pseudocaelatus]